MIMNSESKLGLQLPCALHYVVNIQVLVRVVPTHYIETGIIVEHIIRKGTHFGEVAVSLHLVVLHIELKTLLSSYCFVKTTEYQYSLAVYWHAHC